MIIVTSDHSHTMSIAGYSDRGVNILGMNSGVGDINHLKYPTLSYANGPSSNENSKKAINDEDLGKTSFNYSKYIKLEI